MGFRKLSLSGLLVYICLLSSVLKVTVPLEAGQEHSKSSLRKLDSPWNVEDLAPPPPEGSGVLAEEPVKPEVGMVQSHRERLTESHPAAPAAFPIDLELAKSILRLNMDKIVLFEPLVNQLKTYVDTNWLMSQPLLTLLNAGAVTLLDRFPKLLENKVFHGTLDALMTEFRHVNMTDVNTEDAGAAITTIISRLSYSNVLAKYYELLERNGTLPESPSLRFTLQSAVLNFTMVTMPAFLRHPAVLDIAQFVQQEIMSVNLTGVGKSLPQLVQAYSARVNWEGILSRIYTDLRRYQILQEPPTIQSLIATALLNLTLGQEPRLLANPLTWEIGNILLTDLKSLDFSTVDPSNLGSSLGRLASQLHPGEVYAKINALPGMQGKVSGALPVVSRKCAADVWFVLTSLLSAKSWALAMVDALGKPGSGLLKGNLYGRGNYDQCVAATAYDEHTWMAGEVQVISRRERFRGQFCRVSINLPKSFVDSLGVNTRGLPVRLSWGFCVPDTCTEGDVTGVFSTGLISKLNLDIEEVYCGGSKQLKDDPSGKAAIGVLAFLLFMVAAGTLVDVIYNHKPDGSETPEVRPPAGSFYANGVYIGEDTEQKRAYELLTFRNKEDLTDNGVITDGTKIEFGHTQNRPVSTEHDSILVRIWSSFSVVSNAPKVLAASHSKDSITCIHGIRYISMAWVILCNTFYIGVYSISDNQTAVNLLDATSFLQRFTFMPIIYGAFAVDTFFLLSGFLVAHLFFKYLDKHNGKLGCRKMIMFYVHRYWRLTPVYMVVLMAFSSLYPYLASGPLFPRLIQDAENCRANWWTNLLYVNNLVNDKQMCMAWSWYLANDMQFYIISPVFILALYFFPVVGVMLTSLLVAASITSTAIIEHKGAGNILSGNKPPPPGMVSYYFDIFIKPWCRVGAYAIGLLLAKLLHHRGKKPFNRILALIGWMDAIAVGLFLTYIGYTELKAGAVPWTNNIRSAFESLSRPAFACAVAWVIFACHSGMGGVVNTILSYKGFVPLARLTYAAYLIHPILMVVYAYTRRSMIHIDDYTMAYFFIGHECLAFAGAFILSLAFEVPFANLEKVLVTRISQNKKK